jgi:hypothetical protein
MTTTADVVERASPGVHCRSPATTSGVFTGPDVDSTVEISVNHRSVRV